MTTEAFLDNAELGLLAIRAHEANQWDEDKGNSGKAPVL
jgi:hypothetical protein